MIALRSVAATVLALMLVVGSLSGASALERLRIVGGSKGSWDTSVILFGQRNGIFASEGLDLDIFYGDGSPITIQAVASGSADIGVGANVIGVIGAAMKGAPVKMISSTFDGAPDILFYVRADSPLKRFSDITDQTIGYSAKGASNHIVALALMNQTHVKGRLVAVGTESATLTQVMAGQLDVGHDGMGGMGESEFVHGDVRVIGVGSDAESLRGLTMRGIITGDAMLANKRDTLVRFIRAYRKTIDWMYTNPEALQWFADEDSTSLDQAKSVVAQYYPREAMRIGPIQKVDMSVDLGLQFHRLDQAPTQDQLSKMFDIVAPAGQ